MAEGSAQPDHEAAEAVAVACKCWREHACTRDGERPLCRAERIIGTRFALLSNGRGIPCPYHVAFGPASSVCSCPVHVLLARRRLPPTSVPAAV